jgi:hypothetical protein
MQARPARLWLARDVPGFRSTRLSGFLESLEGGIPEIGIGMQPEVRMARPLDAIARYRAGWLSLRASGGVVGMSERHFRRLRDRYEADIAGLDLDEARP